MKKILLFTILATVILNLSPIFTHAEEKLNKDLMKIINEFVPSNSIQVSPEEPKLTNHISFMTLTKMDKKSLLLLMK